MAQHTQVPVHSACFLLPKAAYRRNPWPVIACDQYTADTAYWERVRSIVGNQPSTLQLILPEAYLDDAASRIPQINEQMEKMLSSGFWDTLPEGMIVTERITPSGVRNGLLVTVDLEQYSFAPGSTCLIRPTEKTVKERIPPRLKIREKAPLELSHILLLIDDPEKTVIEPVVSQAEQGQLEQLYDFQLMLNGGKLRGWFLPGSIAQTTVLSALDRMLRQIPDTRPLIAVGDGNHSLATAKSHWDAIKSTLRPEQRQMHPARYAMAELINLHCDALSFQPIHRFVFNKDTAEVLRMLQPCETTAQFHADVILVEQTGKHIGVRLLQPTHPLTVGTVQERLDRFDVKIDYIHGEDSVQTLALKGAGTGLLLPAMQKADLFPAVAAGGVLPRKTFSMGEADEKRFYCEARVIR